MSVSLIVYGWYKLTSCEGVAIESFVDCRQRIKVPGVKRRQRITSSLPSAYSDLFKNESIGKVAEYRQRIFLRLKENVRVVGFTVHN